MRFTQFFKNFKMRETLKNKIAESLNIIKENTADFENIKVAFSGGKDSVVIYHLAKEANLVLREIKREQ